jgi:hypothetical protein
VSISELVNRHHITCNQFLQAILETEQTPYTQNGHYLETCKDKWLAKYKDARAGRVEASLLPPAKRARHVIGDRNPTPIIHPRTTATQTKHHIHSRHSSLQILSQPLCLASLNHLQPLCSKPLPTTSRNNLHLSSGLELLLNPLKRLRHRPPLRSVHPRSVHPRRRCRLLTRYPPLKL